MIDEHRSWLAISRDFFDDPKVLLLGDDRDAVLFIFQMLCHAKRFGKGGKIEAEMCSPFSLSRILRLPGGEQQAERLLKAVLHVGIMKRTEDGGVCFPAWDKWQRRPSDMPDAMAERQRRSRDARKNNNVTPVTTCHELSHPDMDRDRDMDRDTDNDSESGCLSDKLPETPACLQAPKSDAEPEKGPASKPGQSFFNETWLSQQAVKHLGGPFGMTAVKLREKREAIVAAMNAFPPHLYAARWEDAFGKAGKAMRASGDLPTSENVAGKMILVVAIVQGQPQEVPDPPPLAPKPPAPKKPRLFRSEQRDGSILVLDLNDNSRVVETIPAPAKPETKAATATPKPEKFDERRRELDRARAGREEFERIKREQAAKEQADHEAGCAAELDALKGTTP